MKAGSPEEQRQTRTDTQAGENSSVPQLLAVPTLIMPPSPGWHRCNNSLQLCSTEKQPD